MHLQSPARHRVCSAFSAATLLFATGFAIAREPEPAPAQPAATEPDALSGPRVSTPAEKPTLVKRDFAGALVKLETRPEAAAVELLGLDKDQHAAADAILTKRAEIVHKALSENLATFLEIQAVRQGGGNLSEMRPKMRALREAAPELFDPPLMDQLAKTMPDDKTAQMHTLVTEYITALAAEGAKERGTSRTGEMNSGRGRENARGPRPAAPSSLPTDKPGAMPRQVENNLVLRELGRSLSALVTERKQHTEQMLKAINATPEQESQIQAILRSNDKQGQKLEPTQEQRAEIVRKIMAVLTPEQRKQWLAAQRGGR